MLDEVFTVAQLLKPSVSDEIKSRWNRPSAVSLNFSAQALIEQQKNFGKDELAPSDLTVLLGRLDEDVMPPASPRRQLQ